jgi:hypothetical protein
MRKQHPGAPLPLATERPAPQSGVYSLERHLAGDDENKPEHAAADSASSSGGEEESTTAHEAQDAGRPSANDESVLRL